MYLSLKPNLRGRYDRLQIRERKTDEAGGALPGREVEDSSASSGLQQKIPGPHFYLEISQQGIMIR
jgi:hypothetical protein